MTKNGFDIENVRASFPILSREMNGKPLVYLDTAASAQKPQSVLDSLQDLYANKYANIHRGVYELSATATALHEKSRKTVARFLNAKDSREIVFTRNATEAINLVAQSWGRKNLEAGDEILITEMEHHANIVPWQIICENTGSILQVAPIDDRGVLIADTWEQMLNAKTRIVSFGHISNALGTVNPVAEMVSKAKANGSTTLIDGAQAVSRTAVDVQDLDCDFYVFSSHKLYGPSGVGVLYGKAEILEDMPPYQGGGDMIKSVSFKRTSYAEIPFKFEAGTPDIAGIIGLGKAIEFLTTIGINEVEKHESELLRYGTRLLEEIDGVHIIGVAPEKMGILSFMIEGIHPHDIGTILDQEGVAIRAGHHCAQPLMERLGVAATARASLGIYNTTNELDQLGHAIKKTIDLMS